MKLTCNVSCSNVFSFGRNKKKVISRVLNTNMDGLDKGYTCHAAHSQVSLVVSAVNESCRVKVVIEADMVERGVELQGF